MSETHVSHYVHTSSFTMSYRSKRCMYDYMHYIWKRCYSLCTCETDVTHYVHTSSSTLSCRSKRCMYDWDDWFRISQQMLLIVSDERHSHLFQMSFITLFQMLLTMSDISCERWETELSVYDVTHYEWHPLWKIYEVHVWFRWWVTSLVKQMWLTMYIHLVSQRVIDLWEKCIYIDYVYRVWL